LSPILIKFGFSQEILLKFSIANITKIRPVAAALMRADKQAEEQI
jgi:hypothetical protein